MLTAIVGTNGGFPSTQNVDMDPLNVIIESELSRYKRVIFCTRVLSSIMMY